MTSATSSTRLLVLFITFCGIESWNTYLNCSSDAGLYPLRFVGFFPCSDTERSRVVTKDCDTRTAVEHAIALINQDTNLLKCFRIELFPINIQDSEKSPTELFEILYNEYDDQPIHGVIGPYHADTAKMFAYVFGRYLPTVQISYSVTSILLEDSIRYPYFHSTVSNDVYFSRVLIELMEHFNWRKVAVLSTIDEPSVIASETITREAVMHDSNTLIRLLGSYIDSAEALLNEAKMRGFRIFVALVDPLKARDLLCQAYRANLTTAHNVWILRGVISRWWELDNVNSAAHDCTNDQIIEAINSMLFIDVSSRQPPINEWKKVLLQVSNKVNYNISNETLVENDIHHLLHSQVLNAYDAAKILALAWNVTLHNFTTEELGYYLNQSWKDYNESIGMKGAELVEALDYNLINIVSPYNGLAGSYEFSRNESKLGSSFITQFIGNGECIIGYYASSNSSYVQQLQHCYADYCCNVTWKGNFQPTDGTCPNGSCTCRQPIDSRTLATFIVSIILLIAGIVVSILLQFVNYRWRNNKYFKSSSPPLNAIITFGCTMGYVDGLLWLGSFYVGLTGKGDLEPFCNVSFSVWWLQQVLVTSTILMKNWRIFKIFRNPTQQKRGNLSNLMLIVKMCLICSPVVLAVLICPFIWPYKEKLVNFPSPCPGYPAGVNTSVIEGHCADDVELSWDDIVLLYVIFLYLSIIVLGVFNSRIHSHFNQEGELAVLTGTVSLLIVGLIIVGHSNVFFGRAAPMIKDQMSYGVGLNLLYNSFVLTVLYGSKPVLILKDKKSRPKLVKRKSTIRRKFSDLHDEIFDLKRQLEKIDDSISAEQLKSVHVNICNVTSATNKTFLS